VTQLQKDGASVRRSWPCSSGEMRWLSKKWCGHQRRRAAVFLAMHNASPADQLSRRAAEMNGCAMSAVHGARS
jgi:hypothetical protein